MTEHTIRLRGGWRITLSGDPEGDDRAFRLPVTPAPSSPWTATLDRAWNVPAIDPERESVHLRMTNVAGVRRVVLDGRTLLAEKVVDGATLEFRLDVAPGARAILRLEVDTAGVPDAPGEGWGDISLVIRDAGGVGGARAAGL